MKIIIKKSDGQTKISVVTDPGKASNSLTNDELRQLISLLQLVVASATFSMEYEIK